MTVEFAMAILKNTDKCLGNPAISGALREMLELQKARILFEIAPLVVGRGSKELAKPKFKPKLLKKSGASKVAAAVKAFREKKSQLKTNKKK